MKLNRVGIPLNREERVKVDENWDKIEKGVKDVETSNKQALDYVSGQAYTQVLDRSKLDWKEPVSSFVNLPTSAQQGETRMARDTGKVYRYDDKKWGEIQQIDAGPVNELDDRLTRKLAETMNYLNDFGVNVKANGVLGNGSTDETTVIQTLIDLVASQGGGTVYFPKGDYIAYLNVPSNVKLLGVGYDSCIKLPPNRKYAVPVIANADKENGNYNITIENLRVDGNRANKAIDAVTGIGMIWEGINFTSVENLTIRNVWVENCDNEGVDLDGGKTILIDGLYVENCGGSPLHPSNGQGDLSSVDVIIRNVWSKNNGHTHQRGTFIYDSDNVILDGYYSENDYMGLQILANNVKVNNVTVKNATDQGVRITSSNNIQLSNIDIDNVGSVGLVITGSVSKVNISNVNIKNPGSHGFSFEGADIQGQNLKSESSAGIGILVVGRNISLVNINSIDSTVRGIHVESSTDIKLNGLTIKNSKSNGLNLLNSKDVLLSGSNITGNQGYGITINGTSSKYVITGNDLSNNPNGAIYGTRVGHLIENNIGDINKTYGSVVVPAGTSKVTVNHEQGVMPQFVTVTPTPSEATFSKIEIGSRTSTKFDLILTPAPSQNVTFLWKVE